MVENMFTRLKNKEEIETIGSLPRSLVTAP